MDKIPLSKSIKDLVGGKSTLQNKIFGNLQQELALAVEKSEEHPLEELGLALGSGFSGALGNYSTGLISHLTRYFDSSWNWVRQDTLLMYSGKAPSDVMARLGSHTTA